MPEPKEHTRSVTRDLPPPRPDRKHADVQRSDQPASSDKDECTAFPARILATRRALWAANVEPTSAGSQTFEPSLLPVVAPESVWVPIPRHILLDLGGSTGLTLVEETLVETILSVAGFVRERGQQIGALECLGVRLGDWLVEVDHMPVTSCAEALSTTLRRA